MINRTVTVRQLREKISNTSIVNMGSLNQSHPPLNSMCQQIRLRGAWYQVTRVYWEKWAFNAMEREKTDMDTIEFRAKVLWETLEGEGANLGYALRRHNAKMHQANTPGQSIILQDVLEDWVSMRYDLTLERTAAVIHLQTMLMVSSILHDWVAKMETYKDMASLRKTIQGKLRTVKGSFDLRSDIWEVGGYNVASADQGSFDAIEKRNRTFSCIRDYTTTTSTSQVAQGTSDVDHIDGWNIPLLPKDGRYPPAQGVPPTWDPIPIVMMNQQQSAADDERRRSEAGTAPPPAPAPKARPAPAGGDASSSSGAAGGSAKPPPKARPRPPDGPPEWVTAEPPIGYKLFTSSCPDQRGTLFSSSAWMDENDQFLLSIIQGPAAAVSHISGWAQYLRRVTAYGCMVFGVCNNNVVTDADSARISEIDWLRCYSHIVRTYGLTRTGCYLSTAGLLMMLGKNDREVAHQSGLGETVKKICNPLACEIIENPKIQKSSDVLSGKFRQGTTILITDLAHHIGTSSGKHDLGMGLRDMGWSIDLFKIHESPATLPIAKLRDTVSNVIEFLDKDLDDKGLVTIHIWLSLQFLHDAKPPHHVLVLSSFQKEFVQAASRPVIVAINTDSMFNGMDSITSRLAVEMTESLKREGVMVTTDQRMWRSMHSQFGSQFTTMRSARRGTLGKSAIWSVIEKNLFRQRVFLMCATNREHVSTLNERAFRPKDSGVDPEMLTNVTGPTQVFRIASGDMTPDDYAKGDAPIYQKGASTTGSTTTRFNKDHRYKAQWIEPIARSYELEPDESNVCYWFPVFYDSVDFLCANCRAAKSMDEIELSQHNPTTCIHCSANTQDHYRRSAPTLSARKSVLLLAARLKVAFKNCGLDKLDISTNFREWLIFAASSVISNPRPLKYGEELMKSLSNMGGVRIPYNQAREIFKNGRGKQFSIYRERIFDKGPGKWILAFRVTKDCGNVAYKDFFEQVAVPEMKERNEIFAFSRATAEKVGDIIEFWLGTLDIASMAKGVVDVFDDHIDPTEFLNGLEKALNAFGSSARTTFTTNDKRRGSFDCTLQTAEAEEVMTLINTIPDYESLTDFDCMTAWEKQQVIKKFRKRFNIDDDVDMEEEANVGDEADDELDQGLSAPPDEEDAEEPNEADTEAARASERSGKQYLLDALGSFFTASEEVNVCIFCGSTRHAHDECEDPKKGDLKKALDAIRNALEGESSGSDVDIEQEGGQEKKDESKGPAEPDKARTGEYHWYDESRLMSEVGDLDEAGRFCIDGCDVGTPPERRIQTLFQKRKILV